MRLIDADKLLAHINSIRNDHIEKRNEGDECDRFANDAVADWLFILSNDIEKGIFDPDPAPVPTIKPGDKVVITDAMNEYFIGTKAIVEKISKSAPYSAKLKGIHGEWPLSSLEVISHD